LQAQSKARGQSQRAAAGGARADNMGRPAAPFRTAQPRAGLGRSRAKTQRHHPSWPAVAAVVALAGALGFGQLTHWGTNARPARPFLDEADRLAERAGFGITQVSVTGHRMTPDSDVFAALDLEATRSLIRFDGQQARSRVESLPWVKTATISRLLPDGISVAITERSPFAVWSRSGGDALIDETGRVLGPIPAGSREDLPRVAGSGAPLAAPVILAEIRRYPALAQRMEAAVLIGERRWSLQLRGGPEVKLPAGKEGPALDELMALEAQSHILDPKFSIVDLRVSGRLLLRPRAADTETSPRNVQPSG
jgi:cell division protein FtsQ